MTITSNEVRSLVIDCLQKDRPYNPSGQPFNIAELRDDLAKLAKSRNVKYNESLDAWLEGPNGRPAELRPQLLPVLSDIVWDLIVEGVLRPGDGRDSIDLPHIHLTDHGKNVIKGTVSPNDRAGFLNEIATRIPNADPIITKYIAESAETYRGNCFLSSTVTLGCASEKAFLILLDAYRNALNSADQTTFDAALQKTRTIKAQHQLFMTEYATLAPKLKTCQGTDWMTGMDNALSNLFNYFRDMRNDAGHPTGATFSRELVASHLVVFPYYLRLIYDLIEWISNNKPL